MSEAFPYSVVQGAGESGRIAVASRPLSPGEIVLAERAVVCVAALGRDVCDDCLEPVRAGARCALCLGGDCGGGITPPGVCATDAVRLAAKLLWRRCSGFLEPGHELDVDGLVHHEELFARECGHDQEEDCAQMVKLAAGMAPGRSAAGSAAETATESGMRVLSDAMTCSRRTVVDPLKLAKQELGRVHVNAITTCDGSGATGLGLFPLAAMFNHSCSPNLQAWWRGSKLELRCTKAVATAEELCFSYISIDQPSKLRREQLRHGWFFTCFCQRCVSGKWDAELTGLRCPRASCAGAAPPPWEDSGASCNHCGCVIGAALAPEENQPLDQQRSVSSPSPSSAEAKRLRTEFAGDGGGGGARERFLEARRDFESGVRAYMREDAEAAFVALAKKSLVVQESLLHPFNKELLRTLRFASYAAVATSNWVEAHSFLVRWLHPMEVMFGAAEMWDIAIMRIDLGLVLDKLHPTNTSGASASPPSSAAATSSQRKPSPQETPSTQEKGNDETHPDAIAELAQGLRWIWICLGKDSGLPAEGAALEACLTSRSRRLLQAAASVV